jgi:23S rRNA-/tRNA-specific pseudouridylate synthase
VTVLYTEDKPPGLPVLPPHGDPPGDCVVARVLTREPARGAIAWPDGFPAGVLHRLDTPTSGAVAFAADLAQHAAVRALFAKGALRKVYRFLAARDVPWDEHGCTAALAHDPRHKNRMVVQRGRDTPHRGRWLEASTTFRRIEGRLFEATITTGVMHQVRVHAAFVGIPLAGDRRYGGGETPDIAPAGATFLLHHVGFSGGGFETAPVPLPAWASEQRPGPGGEPVPE